MSWASFAGSKVQLCGLIMLAGVGAVGAVYRQVGSIGKCKGIEATFVLQILEAINLDQHQHAKYLDLVGLLAQALPMPSLLDSGPLDMPLLDLSPFQMLTSMQLFIQCLSSADSSGIHDHHHGPDFFAAGCRCILRRPR